MDILTKIISKTFLYEGTLIPSYGFSPKMILEKCLSYPTLNKSFTYYGSSGSKNLSHIIAISSFLVDPMNDTTLPIKSKFMKVRC